MRRYVYAFRLEVRDDEAFFCFPKFPEIVSGIDRKKFRSMSKDEREAHAHDAVITALQAAIVTQADVPAGDSPEIVRADGFVRLSVRESMKLELYKLYKAECKTVSAFARFLGKPETAARRLLDLRHGTKANEIEKAIGAFGKRLVHDWSLEAVA